jgi:ubiquitin fusion degradation protein 1
MPPSALDRLGKSVIYLFLTCPFCFLMLMHVGFELRNPSAGQVSHCGVLEFVADEGLISLFDLLKLLCFS